MPVLPEVASSRILSFVSAPDRSPSRIMRAAGRSFTEPPGFFHSALAYSSTFRSPCSKPDRRISGVFPIKSMMEAAVRGSPGVATDMSDWSSPGLYPGLGRVAVLPGLSFFVRGLTPAPAVTGVRPRVPSQRPDPWALLGDPALSVADLDRAKVELL